MSADFWAGYISGAVGIVIGNPLDVLKVRLQASSSSAPTPSPQPPILPQPASATNTVSTAAAAARSYLRPFLTGTAAPVLGYGALNALLFVSYNRTEAALNHILYPPLPNGAIVGTGANLWTTWIAGAVGGLATWVVSTPTELVKCRAQLVSTPTSSWAITKHTLSTAGIRGLYFGGAVTALRDSIGYGFYFWSYELTSRLMLPTTSHSNTINPDTSSSSSSSTQDAARILLCGGLAGIVTWASIFPLDVIKTRVQTQNLAAVVKAAPPPFLPSGGGRTETAPLLFAQTANNNIDNTTNTKQKQQLGAWDIAKETYREGGIRPFFRGLAVCSVRAFIVNAVQWAVYEWIMLELGQGRRRGGQAAS